MRRGLLGFRGLLGLLGIAILVAGCASPAGDQAEPTPSPSAIPSPATSTPAIPSPSPPPTAADDLADPGLPAQKKAFAVPDWLPEGYLAFDPDRYQAFERTVHGTRVVVPIDKDLLAMDEIGGHPVVPPEAFLEFLASTFDAQWHIFGGHLYDEVRFPVRGPNDPCSFVGATAVGYPICFSDHASAEGDTTRSPHPLTLARIPELMTHEMFHMWNGGAFTSVPRDVEGFPVEAWSTEGATSYYAARVLGPSGFERAMRVELAKYERALPEAGGLSFQEIADRTIPPRNGPSAYNDMLYARGALVSYLLDVELAKHNASLDDVMARMYAEHGLTGKPFEHRDIQRHAEAVAAADLDAFFATWVDGGADFEGEVEFLPR